MQYGGIVPLNRKLLATKPAPDRPRIWFLLDSYPIVRGTDLRDARSATDSMDQPVTAFTLNQDAATRFERYSAAHIGQDSAIVLDDEILSVRGLKMSSVTRAKFAVRTVVKRPRISPSTSAPVLSPKAITLIKNRADFRSRVKTCYADFSPTMC